MASRLASGGRFDGKDAERNHHTTQARWGGGGPPGSRYPDQVVLSEDRIRVKTKRCSNRTETVWKVVRRFIR